jgi:hypothetical protein
VSQETHWEDQMIVAALEGLERGADPGFSGNRSPGVRNPETAETAETLARLYTEVLGLIPFELEPAVPSADSRQRLLSAIGVPAGGPQPVAAAPAPIPESAPFPEQLAPTVAFPAFTPPPPQDPLPVHEEAAEPFAAVRRQPPRPVPLAARRSSAWPVALAAGLLLALGLSGWLYLQKTEQQATIARLQSEVREARQKEAQAAQEAERFRREFTTLRTTMTLVTAPAALVGPLRPVGKLQPDARGALFVAADHQHWHLSIEGLKPAPQGRVYQLWFVADQGPPVNGGTFVAAANERVELTSEAMPPTAKSAMITLEPAGGGQSPEGPEVLRAAEMVQIL